MDDENDTIYADDIAVGVTHDVGHHLVTTAEIVEFASMWDPQDFHVDEAVAVAGTFGGLIASGIHSIAIMQRLAVRGLVDRWAVIAGRSITDVQFTSPVRPGMNLRGTVRIDGVEPRGDTRSLVHQTLSLWDGPTCVLSFRLSAYVARRPRANDLR